MAISLESSMGKAFDLANARSAGGEFESTISMPPQDRSRDDPPSPPPQPPPSPAHWNRIVSVSIETGDNVLD